MKLCLTIAILLCIAINASGQKALKDSVEKKESFAVAEIGGAASLDIKGNGASYGYNIAVEVTPIEDWLELEMGITSSFGIQLREQDVDLLFKKPWTLSPKAEFMFGLGLAWNHQNSYGTISNTGSGEVALDFMFWPLAKHRFGWYLEPAYEYGFSQGHEQSIGMSAGLLIAIP